MLIVQKHLQAVTKALVGKDSAPIGELLDKIKELQAENEAEKKQVRLIEKQCQENGNRAANLQADLKAKNEALKIARTAMDKASMMYFRDLKGIDKMLAEKDDLIEQALKKGG